MITQIDKTKVSKQGEYPSYKVVMFGASQVGKTSILEYFDKGKFTETASTNDVSFKSYHALFCGYSLLAECTSTIYVHLYTYRSYMYIIRMGDIEILLHDYCHEQISRLSRLLPI